ncbi:MAG: phosphocholine cytidylyltransferase family protein [Gammaproteobacteria bacterium]|nr:phosphocholine cytidylyltransferase family protein [Gammaproteobacteria bacterium]
MDKLAITLEADIGAINDWAGYSKNAVPPDISGYIQGNTELISLLRLIKSYDLNKSEIAKLNKITTSNNAEAIIIAAGLGSRLKGYTENLPKCMLKFGNKTLLERQLDAYRDCGIRNISVVRGYKKEKISYEGLTYYHNDDYENNDILNSLFYAEEALVGNVVVAYSDILFEPAVVKRLLESNADISIVVDIDWQGYYVDRKEHPAAEAEKVIFNADNEVLKIGKFLTCKDDVYGEFIGMLKFSARGAEIFKKHFHRSKKLYWDQPFQRARTFQKAYLTDLIQEMVDLGVGVHCVIIERGWKEIDTEEDYQKALKDFDS